MAAVMQYICSELLELAGNECEKDKKKQIKPRHAMLAIRADVELNKLVGANCDFPNTGVVPNIKSALVNNGKGKGKGKKGASGDGDIDME